MVDQALNQLKDMKFAILRQFNGTISCSVCKLCTEESVDISLPEERKDPLI